MQRNGNRTIKMKKLLFILSLVLLISHTVFAQTSYIQVGSNVTLSDPAIYPGNLILSVSPDQSTIANFGMSLGGYGTTQTYSAVPDMVSQYGLNVGGNGLLDWTKPGVSYNIESNYCPSYSYCQTEFHLIASPPPTSSRTDQIRVFSGYQRMDTGYVGFMLTADNIGLGNPTNGNRLWQLVNGTFISNDSTDNDLVGIFNVNRNSAIGGSGVFAFDKSQDAYRVYPGGGIGNPGLKIDGKTASGTYGTTQNCITAMASPVTCSQAAAGAFAVATGSTTLTLETTAVTARSEIFVTENAALARQLGVTCNTNIIDSMISTIAAGTSFTVTLASAPSVNPACYGWFIIN